MDTRWIRNAFMQGMTAFYQCCIITLLLVAVVMVLLQVQPTSDMLYGAACLMVIIRLFAIVLSAAWMVVSSMRRWLLFYSPLSSVIESFSLPTRIIVSVALTPARKIGQLFFQPQRQPERVAVSIFSSPRRS